MRDFLRNSGKSALFLADSPYYLNYVSISFCRLACLQTCFQRCQKQIPHRTVLNVLYELQPQYNTLKFSAYFIEEPLYPIKQQFQPVCVVLNGQDFRFSSVKAYTGIQIDIHLNLFDIRAESYLKIIPDRHLLSTGIQIMNLSVRQNTCEQR